MTNLEPHLVIAWWRSTWLTCRIRLGPMSKTLHERGDTKQKRDQICDFPKSPQAAAARIPFKPHLFTLVCHRRKSRLWQYRAWFHTVEGWKITIDLLAECRAEWIWSDSSCFWFYFTIRTDVLFLDSKIISYFLQINIYMWFYASP